MGSLSNGMHFLENVRRGNVFFMSDRMNGQEMDTRRSVLALWLGGNG